MKNCSYLMYVYVKSFVFNANRITFTKDVNKLACFIKYLVIVYALGTKNIRSNVEN